MSMRNGPWPKVLTASAVSTSASILTHRITVEQRERFLRVAHGCTVHQSIAVTPSIGIKLNPSTHR